ncbi:MAG: RNA polymerase sigma factor [Eggerthellaceae bacterium]|nr:RNA polymerase sigma factor [Eggerthellaceae bacterium]
MNTDELETLYRNNFQKVYSYVYYRVLDPAIAEDVTADVFMKVVANYDRFDPARASFSTWAMRIAHNTLVDYYRMRKVHVPIDQLGAEEPHLEDDYPALDEKQAEVARLLSFLSPDDREIIFLKYHEDMKNVEIARLLGMNPATVATRIRRALQTMRSQVKETNR